MTDIIFFVALWLCVEALFASSFAMQKDKFMAAELALVIAFFALA